MLYLICWHRMLLRHDLKAWFNSYYLPHITFYMKFGKIARTVHVFVMAVLVVWARWCPCRSWVHGEVICVSGGIWCCQLVGNKLGASSSEENIFVFMRCDNNNIGRDLTARLWLILSNWKKKTIFKLKFKNIFQNHSNDWLNIM